MKPLRIPDGLRNKGIHCLASRGSGKSRLIGRELAFKDFYRGVATVLIDNGDAIDNVLDKITRLPESERKKLWPRVRYINMAGMGDYIVPFPLYYRLGQESDFAVAERLMEVIRRIDPALQNAPIQGMNAVLATGREVGKKLVERGWQITEAPTFLADKKIVNRPEIFKEKIKPFFDEPILKLMVGAEKPGIDWQEVLDKKQIVLLDFRDTFLFREEVTRFLMRWVFEYLVSFAEFRGVTRTDPIAVYIDELSSLTSCSSPAGAELFVQDLNKLLHIIMRRHNVWLTLAHQAMHSQFSPAIQRLLMSMEVQMIGSLPDIDDAITVARQLETIDPRALKRLRTSSWNFSLGAQYTEDYLTPQEQLYVNAYPFRDMPALTFQSVQISKNVSIKFHIKNIDPGCYPDEQKDTLTAIRLKLMERDGRKKSDVEEEIASRITGVYEERPAYPQQPQTEKKVVAEKRATFQARGEL